MESTGIYWKSLYAALEQAGIPAHVVNARHARNVPGRKTDISDSEWLAQLGRFGWLKPSFIPPQDLRELPLVARYREKLAQILAGEKNRLHQTLDDAGIKLGAVVADIGGVSAQAMIEGLIAGTSVEELPELAKGVLRHLQGPIHAIESELGGLDRYRIDAMAPYADYWHLLQTLPGLDQIAAALILVEIGTDLGGFLDASHFASWAGLCPGNQESAGQRKSGKTRKRVITRSAISCEKSPAEAGGVVLASASRAFTVT
jgi:transposase